MSLQIVESRKLSRVAIKNLDHLTGIQQTSQRCSLPVGIIGPGDGGEKECAAARYVAGVIATAGLSIVCGGRGGVMEAAAHGATENGGIALGILPEEDLSGANRYLTISIPTGMGEMRNALIARSSICLVAIGGGMGTLSEIALGLKWGKPVFTLFGDTPLAGAQAAKDLGNLVDAVLAFLASKIDRPR
jgi:uncharacterized protein (TIGR00725 family)